MKSDALVRTFLEHQKDNIEFWEDMEDNKYLEVKDKEDKSIFHLNTKNSAIKQYLYNYFQRECNKIVMPKNLDEVIQVLSYQYNSDITKHKTYIRVGMQDEALYINLNNQAKQYVKITTAGWEIVTHSPLKFVAFQSTLPLPIPARDGNLKDLGKILNFGTDENLMLMASWLIASFHPHGPYVILGINGGQGTAKSTNSRFLRNLIDTNANALREPPNNIQDFRTIVRNNYVIAMDNLSHIKNDFSDQLCRLAYGESIGGRKLYTDYDDAAFAVARPILINGIPDLAERPDLIDRMVGINLPKIPDNERTSDSALSAAFKKYHPSILGAICDHLVFAMRDHDKIELDFKPRMIEYAKWVAAAFGSGKSWPAEFFLKTYKNNLKESVIETANSDELIKAIRSCLKQHGKIEGTSSEIYPLIADFKDVGCANFPKTVKGFGNYLKRMEPLLAELGIRVQRKVANSKRTITIHSSDDKLLST